MTHVVNTYPDAEVTPPARKTLELMDKGFSKIKKTGSAGSGDDGGELSNPKNPRYAGFTDKLKPNDKIFILMYIDKNQLSKSEATSKINAFNGTYYKDLKPKLRVYTFLYKQTHLLPYISSFKKLEDAKKYMEQFNKDAVAKEVLKGDEPKIFYISHSNFKIAYGKKRMQDYVLYSEHILK